MRSRFPAIVLGLTLLAGSLAAALTASVATAPHARSGAWAFTGIDVSKWQETIDWPTVATQVDFAIIKATESQSMIDPAFATNRANAAAAGVRIGMYHVASPSASLADARAEANHFLQVAAPGAGNLIPALDIEINRVPDWMTSTQLEAWARAWLNHVTRQARRAPDGLRQRVHVRDLARQHDVVRRPRVSRSGLPGGGRCPPRLPADDWQGQGWTFWQWSSTGTVPGITTDVDRDRYVGTKLSRATIASLTAQPGVGRLDRGRLGSPRLRGEHQLHRAVQPDRPDRADGDPRPGLRVRVLGRRLCRHDADVLADRARHADRDGDVQPPVAGARER